MYWKRATYFWAFIVAIFVAYFAAIKELLDLVAVALALLGFLFSLGWSMVARGSKVWQENWEMHIRYLEEEIHGPLFKTHAIPKMNFWGFEQEYPFSVSKVNQILNLYACLFWLGLFLHSLNDMFPENWKFVVTDGQQRVTASLIFVILFLGASVFLFCKTKSFQYKDLSNGNLEKFYKDEKKKDGDFYFVKRGNQITETI